MLRNSGARAGDVLILSKGIGIGIFSAALKQGGLDATGYATMLASTTQLNRIGQHLAEHPGVHAVTDVTGFGLLGHALEICRGSGLGARIRLADLPLHEYPGTESRSVRIDRRFIPAPMLHRPCGRQIAAASFGGRRPVGDKQLSATVVGKGDPSVCLPR